MKELTEMRDRLARECEDLATLIRGHQDTLRTKQNLRYAAEQLLKLSKTPRSPRLRVRKPI